MRNATSDNERKVYISIIAERKNKDLKGATARYRQASRRSVFTLDLPTGKNRRTPIPEALRGGR